MSVVVPPRCFQCSTLHSTTNPQAHWGTCFVVVRRPKKWKCVIKRVAWPNICLFFLWEIRVFCQNLCSESDSELDTSTQEPKELLSVQIIMSSHLLLQNHCEHHLEAYVAIVTSCHAKMDAWNCFLVPGRQYCGAGYSKLSTPNLTKLAKVLWLKPNLGVRNLNWQEDLLTRMKTHTHRWQVWQHYSCLQKGKLLSSWSASFALSPSVPPYLSQGTKPPQRDGKGELCGEICTQTWASRFRSLALWFSLSNLNLAHYLGQEQNRYEPWGHLLTSGLLHIVPSVKQPLRKFSVDERERGGRERQRQRERIFEQIVGKCLNSIAKGNSLSWMKQDRNEIKKMITCWVVCVQHLSRTTSDGSHGRYQNPSKFVCVGRHQQLLLILFSASVPSGKRGFTFSSDRPQLFQVESCNVLKQRDLSWALDTKMVLRLCKGTLCSVQAVSHKEPDNLTRTRRKSKHVADATHECSRRKNSLLNKLQWKTVCLEKVARKKAAVNWSQCVWQGRRWEVLIMFNYVWFQSAQGVRMDMCSEYLHCQMHRMCKQN